jgi:hypothetical protein
MLQVFIIIIIIIIIICSFSNLFFSSQDVKSMGSVNEKGFLLFFALFIPSLEGTAGPKKQAKQKQEEKKVEPVVVVEDSGEIVRLQKRIAELEAEKVEVKEVAVEANQQVENLSMESETLSSTIQELENKIVVLTGKKQKNREETMFCPKFCSWLTILLK